MHRVNIHNEEDECGILPTSTNLTNYQYKNKTLSTLKGQSTLMCSEETYVFFRRMAKRVETNHAHPNVRINIIAKNNFEFKRLSHNKFVSPTTRTVTRDSKRREQWRQTFELSRNYIDELKAYLCSYPEMRMDVRLQSSQTFCLDANLVSLETVKLSSLDLFSLTPQQIYHYATTNKYSSVAFQSLIESLDDSSLHDFFVGVQPNLQRLLIHRYGNYIVQMLVKRSGYIMDIVVALCTEYFDELAGNEFASRVMQLLVEINTTFRLYSLSRIRTGLYGCMDRISSVLLVAATFRASTPCDLDFFTTEFLRSPTLWISSKAHKRVLTAALQVGTHAFLDVVSHALSLSSRLEDFLQEKYCTTILITMIERDHAAVVSAICQSLLRDALSLCRSRYFRPLVEQMARKDLFNTRLTRALTLCTQYRSTADRPQDLWDLYLSYLLAVLKHTAIGSPVESVHGSWSGPSLQC